VTERIELGPVPAIPVRCERCGRVRYGAGQDWQDHPAKLPGEVRGCCKTCGDVLAMLRERKWAREGRQLLRNRKRGYGPGTGDPFAGMREGDR
jgi:DNA-directed RNA polymerase subunit N (RpoN/RPB10)